MFIPAGVPRKPGMTRDDLFNINEGIVKNLCEVVAKCCPNAIIVNLISNPANSSVPIAAKVFKKAGTYDPRKLMGVTMLDAVRASAFVAYAAVKFADACRRGLRGDADIVQCDFVASEVCP